MLALAEIIGAIQWNGEGEGLKLIVCGGRTYQLTSPDYALLDTWRNLYEVSEVVSGGCSGADQCAEAWALSENLPVKRFNANWATDGKKAGPLRNERMAEYADLCAVFPGGKGTADMKKRAEKHGLTILESTK